MFISQSQSAHIGQHQEQTLGGFGSVGDIPLISLHRFSSLATPSGIGISAEALALLSKVFIEENAAFRRSTGKNWLCLTVDSVTDAIDSFRSALNGHASLVIGDVPLPAQKKTRQFVLAHVHQTVVSVTDWLDANAERLAYGAGSKVPWPIVCALRGRFARWSSGVRDAFSVPIAQFVFEVGEKNRVRGDDPDDVWRSLAGLRPLNSA